jgi:hypothetical protein
LHFDAIADAPSKACFRFDVSMLDETGFELAFDRKIGALESAVHVAMNDATTHKDIIGAVFVDCLSAGASRFFGSCQARKLLPRDWEISEVEREYCRRFTYHRRDGFSAKTRFGFCEHRLICKVRVHAKAISAWNVFRREYRVDSRVILRELRQIPEEEGRSVQGAPHHS